MNGPEANVEDASTPRKHQETVGCFSSLYTQHPLWDLHLQWALTFTTTESHEEATPGPWPLPLMWAQPAFPGSPGIRTGGL